MSIQATPESSGGILNAIKGSLGLFSEQNKANNEFNDSNPVPIDEYESSLNELEVMELVAQWKKDYSSYYDAIKKGQDLSFDYWVGKHRSQEGLANKEQGVTDNLIFEAIETFLPIATRANPEPLVNADPSDVGQEIAHAIKVALANFADTIKLRRKLAKMTRGWLLNRLGVLKMSWNPINKLIELNVINAKKMLFDKDGYIDEGGIFRGEYEGERKKAIADTLIKMFPKKRELIVSKSKGKMGTKLDYIEWWYRGQDVFFTIDDSLLGKFKNPNWNYDTVPVPEPINPDSLDVLEGEQDEEDPIPGTNHLKEILSPYRYLAIFSTGEQPHDNTSLVLQNIPQQDKINRREVQIERNVEGMNNGIVVSGTAFTEEQASQAAAALRRGVAIRVPNGDVGKAVLFPVRPALPPDVFGSLKDGRAELRNIFGTSGSTPEGIKSQETVRGKILVNQMDSSRIGGGITEYIEQVADSVYNLAVQFMFVYYDEEHFITSAGSISGVELITLKNDKFPLLRTLSITIKEGSLVPKDPLTQRNEALDLWSANAIDPRSLYKKLDFPDPDEAANQLILWQMLQKGQIQPQMYLPSFAVAGQPTQGQPLPTGQQSGTGDTSVNPVGASQPGGIVPTPPVESQSQDLLQSVPVQ